MNGRKKIRNCQLCERRSDKSMRQIESFVKKHTNDQTKKILFFSMLDLFIEKKDVYILQILQNMSANDNNNNNNIINATTKRILVLPKYLISKNYKYIVYYVKKNYLGLVYL